MRISYGKMAKRLRSKLKSNYDGFGKRLHSVLKRAFSQKDEDNLRNQLMCSVA